MPLLKISEDVEYYYEDVGEGEPILFIHGVWMSSKFFHKQLPYFQKNYRAIAIDLRGHGRSSKVPYGHTVSQYAKDVHQFIHTLNLNNVTLVGWSMGAFVIWDYLTQFGDDNLKATVIVDELASDFKWPDFEIGAFDIPTLTHFMREIQLNRENFLRGFISLMFKEEPSEEEMAWMLEETTKPTEAIASAILFDQSVVDYRSMLSSIKLPTLLCFGKEEKLIPVAAGEHLKANIPYAQLEIFENSCHCPFFEEADQFNKTVDSFLQSIKK